MYSKEYLRAVARKPFRRNGRELAPSFEFSQDKAVVGVVTHLQFRSTHSPFPENLATCQRKDGHIEYGSVLIDADHLIYIFFRGKYTLEQLLMKTSSYQL